MIRRSPRPPSKYLTIRNEVIRDPKLSLKARGLLLTILSRPDDWRTTLDSLAAECREGRRAIMTGMQELEAAGYVRRARIRGEQGRLTTSTEVYDTPQDSAETAPAEPPECYDGTTGDGTTDNSTTSTKEPVTNNLPLPTVAVRDPDPADEILREWWEQQSPRPSIPYIAAAKVCRRFLSAGNTPDDLRYALDDAPVISGAAFDLSMHRRDHPQRGGVDKLAPLQETYERWGREGLLDQTLDQTRREITR